MSAAESRGFTCAEEGEEGAKSKQRRNVFVFKASAKTIKFDAIPNDWFFNFHERNVEYATKSGLAQHLRSVDAAHLGAFRWMAPTFDLACQRAEFEQCFSLHRDYAALQKAIRSSVSGEATTLTNIRGLAGCLTFGDDDLFGREPVAQSPFLPWLGNLRVEDLSRLKARLETERPELGLNLASGLCSPLWIVKHGAKSRGRDIYVTDSLGEVDALTKTCGPWIVQKYIERPLLFGPFKRKFDIRQWVVVTSWSPLTVWFYESCYLRFAMTEYSIKGSDGFVSGDTHSPTLASSSSDRFMHLSNNSVSKHCPGFDAVKDASMLSSVDFEPIFNSEFGLERWKTAVVSKMKDIAYSTLSVVGDSVKHRERSFELLGFDFMIDSDLNVYLLEINSSPDLSYSTHVTEKLVKSMLPNMLQVLIEGDMQLGLPGMDMSDFKLPEISKTADIESESDHFQSKSADVQSESDHFQSKSDHFQSKSDRVPARIDNFTLLCPELREMEIDFLSKGTRLNRDDLKVRGCRAKIPIPRLHRKRATASKEVVPPVLNASAACRIDEAAIGSSRDGAKLDRPEGDDSIVSTRRGSTDSETGPLFESAIELATSMLTTGVTREKVVRPAVKTRIRNSVVKQMCARVMPKLKTPVEMKKVELVFGL